MVKRDRWTDGIMRQRQLEKTLGHRWYLGLVFRGKQWVENISGSRNEMSNRSRKVKMPYKNWLHKMVLVTVKSFYFFNCFGNGLDFSTLKPPELFECWVYFVTFLLLISTDKMDVPISTHLLIRDYFEIECRGKEIK